jgi:hypothetical protein
VGDFNVPLSSIDRSSRQKKLAENSELKFTMDHADLRDIYRIFDPRGVEYTFFLAVHELSLK